MTDIRDVAPIGRRTTLRGCRVEYAFAQTHDGKAVRIFTPTGMLDLEVSWEEFEKDCWRPVVKPAPPERWVTTWRVPGTMDWDHHFSHSLEDAQRTVENLKKQKVIQYSTMAVAKDNIKELSSEF